MDNQEVCNGRLPSVDISTSESGRSIKCENVGYAYLNHSEDRAPGYSSIDQSADNLTDVDYLNLCEDIFFNGVGIDHSADKSTLTDESMVLSQDNRNVLSHVSTVSREGNAMLEEANEKVALELNSQIGSSMTEMETEGAGQQTQPCSPDSCLEQIGVKFLNISEAELQVLRRSIEHIICTYFELRDAPLCGISYEGQTHDKLKEHGASNDALKSFMEAVSETNRIFCLFQDSISENKWNFQREFAAIIKDSVMREEGAERKLLNDSFSVMIDGARNLREELDHVSRFLVSCELGHLSSQGIENPEERKMDMAKHNHFVMPSDSNKARMDAVDSPQLLHMTKEELISYFKAEITKMKRNHESVLQEKTEELFAVKRELLKGKGSLPSRKDRDCEVLRGIIPEMVSKLDKFLTDVKKFEMTKNGKENRPGNTCNLPWENHQCLRELPLGENEISDCSSEKDICGISRRFLEVEALKGMDKSGWDAEDSRIESLLRDDVENVFFRSWNDEVKNHLEFLDMEFKSVFENYSTVLDGFFLESRSTIDHMVRKHDEMKGLLETNPLQKERLHSKIECLEVDEVCQELSVVRDQKNKLEKLLSDSRDEVHSIMSELENSTHQVRQYVEKISKLDESLDVALNELCEAENEKFLLQNIVQQKQNQILSIIEGGNRQSDKMESLILSLTKVSKSFDAFQGNILEKIHRDGARLENFKKPIDQVRKKVDVLQGEISYCKRKLEIQTSNLRKAETEVDLLGDEVEALIDLLSKIYLALEHYFPVFQHYPGVVEVLKLIKGMRFQSHPN